MSKLITDSLLFRSDRNLCKRMLTFEKSVLSTKRNIVTPDFDGQICNFYDIFLYLFTIWLCHNAQNSNMLNVQNIYIIDYIL